MREEQDWPQRSVAYQLNISQRAYSHYENGSRELPLEILCALANIYQVSTDFLLGRTDIRMPYPAPGSVVGKKVASSQCIPSSLRKTGIPPKNT